MKSSNKFKTTLGKQTVTLPRAFKKMYEKKNVGTKVTGKKVTEKKSQIWVGKKVTGKKVTKKNYAFFQLLVRNKHFYSYYYHYYPFMFCLD